MLAGFGPPGGAGGTVFPVVAAHNPSLGCCPRSLPSLGGTHPPILCPGLLAHKWGVFACESGAGGKETRRASIIHNMLKQFPLFPRGQGRVLSCSQLGMVSACCCTMHLVVRRVFHNQSLALCDATNQNAVRGE